MGDEAGEKKPRRSAAETQAFLKRAQDRFRQGTADTHQRLREVEDLKFYAGEHFPADIKQSRAGQAAADGLPPIPARPCLVINKVREPVKQVLNEERQADLGVELVPADDFGELGVPLDETEIELREGLIRRIQRDSIASDARTWAFARAVIAGVGYYGVMTRYLPGKTWDQEIYVRRFFNQAAVVLDPAHDLPDGSDAEWAFYGVDMPWEEYKAEFPRLAGKEGTDRENPILNASTDEFRALGEDAPEWFTTEGDTRSVRVVEYWYTERTPRTLVRLKDGTPAYQDEIDEDEELDPDTEPRPEVEKKIKWAKIDGAQILDETDWPGPDIPIVKVLGEELQPYDQYRRVEGMVRPSRDAQFSYDVMISKWVELVGLSTAATLQVTPDEVEGFEKWYQVRTTRTLPYLPFNRGPNGERQPPSLLETTLGQEIQGIAASVNLFDQGIKSTTGVGDPQLGNVDPSLKSGKVVEALQRRSQHGTSNFLDNLKRSVSREGHIENRLLYPIYGQRPGRLVRIVTSEGTSQTIRIAPPLPPGGSNGQAAGSAAMGQSIRSAGAGDGSVQPNAGQLAPISAPATPQPNTGLSSIPPPQAPGAPPAMMSAGPPTPIGPKQYRLTKDATLNVVVKVTQAFNSKREQEADLLAQLIDTNPNNLAVFGDLLFKNMDTPGHQELEERAKLMLDPKIQAMLQQKASGQPIPPQAMAQIAQLQKQLQAAHGVIQAAQSEIAAKQTEWAARAQIAKDDREFKATMQDDESRRANETKLAVAAIGAKVETLTNLMQVFMDERARLGTQAHDAALGAAQAGHEAGMAQQDHQNAMAQTAQSAALQPPPAAPDDSQQTGAPPEGS